MNNCLPTPKAESPSSIPPSRKFNQTHRPPRVAAFHQKSCGLYLHLRFFIKLIALQASSSDSRFPALRFTHPKKERRRSERSLSLVRKTTKASYSNSSTAWLSATVDKEPVAEPGSHSVTSNARRLGAVYVQHHPKCVVRDECAHVSISVRTSTSRCVHASASQSFI